MVRRVRVHRVAHAAESSAISTLGTVSAFGVPCSTGTRLSSGEIMKKARLWLAAFAAGLLTLGTAHAGLTTFTQYTGSVAVSTDGWGGTDQNGSLTANVPSGATVVAAYLYTSTFSNPDLGGVGGTLNGSNVGPFTNLGVNTESCCSLAAGRTDVTSIIKPVIDGGAGGAYNFAVTETSSSQDGYALVVVYSLPSLPTSTVAIVDGFARVTGDTTTVAFGIPLDPTDPAFFMEMRLGIGFSCCDTQRSTVTVNGTTITENAGNWDDGEQLANGSLFTMGGDDDPFSALMPSYADDHERYNLVPYINSGDTAIEIRTFNASRDDNIFLAVFSTLGEAIVCEVNCGPPSVPEPGMLGLIGLAAVAFGLQRRRAGGRRPR
jgi:hypothetical protein